MLYRRWQGHERAGKVFLLRHGGQGLSRGFRRRLQGAPIVRRFGRALAHFGLEKRYRCLIMSDRNRQRRSCPLREPLLSSLSGGDDHAIDAALEVAEGLRELLGATVAWVAQRGHRQYR